MLTCVRSKEGGDESLAVDRRLQGHHQLNPNAVDTKHAIKGISSQIKDMALKASGAYRHCVPFTNQPIPEHRRNGSFGGGGAEADWMASEKFRWSYRRTGSSTAGRRELEARLRGISSGERTPAPASASASGRRAEPVVFVEESEPKEWVAQVEAGVLITFLSLPRGGNDLKRIRFSREMFNKWQAQRWWAENSEKVMELYNVQRFNPGSIPLPTTPRSEDDASSKMGSIENSPATPSLGREPLPHTLNRPTGMGTAFSSSDSLDLHSTHSRSNYDSCGVASTPKLSNISGTKTETSSMDASIRTSSSRDADRSGEISISNASDLESEWVEQDEPGVYITIRTLPDGKRELRRVRFRSAGRNLERFMLDCGGKRIELGYTNNTCELALIQLNPMREDAISKVRSKVSINYPGKPQMSILSMHGQRSNRDGNHWFCYN